MKKFYSLLFCLLFIAGLMAGRASAKCQCDCKKYPAAAVCAKDLKSSDTETFYNICQMQCYNCTHGKNYLVIYSGPCK